MSLFSSSASTLKVVILLLPQSSLMSLAATLDTMRAANRISRRNLFDWQVSTVDGEPATLSCGQKIHPDGSLQEIQQGDLLICIAAFSHQKHMPARYLTLFKKQARNFAYIGGVESGSWILARAGYLQDRRATTHWEDLEDFRDAFTNVSVQPDRYVIDGKYFTTGGAAPTIDLFLHLIGTRYGHTLALEVASVFIYNGGQHAQTPQPLVSLGALQTQQPKIAAAIRLMEKHIDTPITSRNIAEQLGVSSRSLELLFRKELTTSPHRYYKRLRLQVAKRLVLGSEHNMQEVAIRCGFNSLAAFSREFKRFFEMSPMRYRQEHK
ncbi:MAG: GlxA family transcriptional regulator [Oceanospirillaceae bacterium]